MTITKFPKSLLAVDSNAKTIKGQKYGFMTGILYLAPSDVSGHQVCPMAKIAGCEKACLYTAGRGAMSNVQLSRLNKTRLFHAHRDEFMARLAVDIAKLVKKAQKAGMVPLVRLNGTSDIRFENVPVNGAPNIMALFPNVQFYDYTKIANRRNLPANYDLTFSYSGVAEYRPFVEKAIAAGMRVAVVFRTKDAIPSRFLGLDCVDGDDSDIRHLDPSGVVVALYAKGQAKHDASGFVVDAQRALVRRVIPVSIVAQRNA